MYNRSHIHDPAGKLLPLDEESQLRMLRQLLDHGGDLIDSPRAIGMERDRVLVGSECHAPGQRRAHHHDRATRRQ